MAWMIGLIICVIVTIVSAFMLKDDYTDMSIVGLVVGITCAFIFGIFALGHASWEKGIISEHLKLIQEVKDIENLTEKEKILLKSNIIEHNEKLEKEKAEISLCPSSYFDGSSILILEPIEIEEEKEKIREK